MPIEISVDMNRIIERSALLALVSDQLPGAMEAAVKDTLKEAEREAENEVHREINAPLWEIAKVIYAGNVRRATRLVVKGQIGVTRRRISLTKMNPVQTPAGVTYFPYRSGGGKQIRSAFGPNIRRLGNGVFRRTGRTRTPIKKEPGFMLQRDRRVRIAMQRAEKKIDRLLLRNADKHVEKLLEASTSGRTIYGPVQVSRVRATAFYFGRRTSAATRGR